MPVGISGSQKSPEDIRTIPPKFYGTICVCACVVPFLFLERISLYEL